MELTKFLPHAAHRHNINWDEATRYAGLNADSGPPNLSLTTGRCGRASQ